METIKIIKTESEYKKALDRLYEIFDAKIGTKDSDEADLLALVIEDYENKHHVIEAPDPIEAIKIRMEELGMKQSDMIDIIGGKSQVSEVLNRKRKLTIKMIRNLKEKLNLPSDLLVQDY